MEQKRQKNAAGTVKKSGAAGKRRVRGKRSSGSDRKKYLIIGAAALLIVVAALALCLPRGGVYVNGENILRAPGNTLSLGSGYAIYDSETRTLRLRDAQISTSAHGAGVYASGDLNLVFEGENSIGGEACAIRAGGSLHISGEGSAAIAGREFALRTGGDLRVSGHVTLDLSGGTAAMRCGGAFAQDALYVNQNESGGAAADIWTAARLIMRAPVRLKYTSYGGGELEMSEFAWGSANLSLPTPVREGFNFLGWYLSNRYEQAFDAAAPLTADTALYAMWEKAADAVYSGVDVSAYQKDIDWAKVKADGVDFALIRAGYRGWGAEGTLNADTYFEANAAGAKKAGLDVGVYFYSQATTPAEAAAEADFVLEKLQGKTPDLPVCFDLEYAEGDGGYIGRLYDAQLTPDEMAAICAAFCERVQAAGCEAMVYANYNLLSGGLGEKLAERGIRIWLAQWNAAPYYLGDYDIWQYTSRGRVDGIDGNVDMNWRYVVNP